MPATLEYLAEHPFASPDIVNPPEAPTYRYRPDLETLVDLAGVETIDLSAGSRIDLVVDDVLESFVLQAGNPTGSALEVVPDDFDATLNQQFWLQVSVNTVPSGSISFDDISGTINTSQLPPGSVVTVDSIGEDALYFFTESTRLPSLKGAVDIVTFLSGFIDFTNISGTIAIEQFPPGTVASLDSIDEDGFYFFDNDTFLPLLIGKDTALAFLLPDQTGNDGKVLQTNAGVLSWATATGGSIATTPNILQGDNAGAAVATDLNDTLVGDLNYSYVSNNPTSFNVANLSTGTLAGAGISITTGSTGEVEMALGVDSPSHNTVGLEIASDSWIFTTGRLLFEVTGATVFSNDGGTTERARFTTGLSIGSTTDAGAGNILLNGLTASSFVETDGSKILVSKTAAQMRTDLGLVIGTNVQAFDSDLSTLAGLTATTDNFIVSVSSAWASRTPAQVRTTLALTVGTDVQAWDADLDALAALSGTHTIYYRSASNTWSAVTIGTGLDFTSATLSATGTSTTVATDVIWDAKGDLAVGTGADTAAKLTVGANNTILMADSAQSTGVKWAVLGTGVVTALLVNVGSAGAFIVNGGVLGTPSSGTLTNCTGLPITALVGDTGTSVTFGSLQIGHASDTSITRSTAGHIQVEGSTVILASDIGSTVQAYDADLGTIAGLTATTDNFIISVSSAWASRTPAQARTTLGLVIGTNVQAWDADLDTLAGLTATTDNFIVSVSSAWASRTPAQVLSTLAAVGTTFQPLDSDLTTIAGLTATTDNFIVSVSSAWASRTPAQVKTTLGLVIGTNVQAWDSDLDTLAGLTATTDNFIVSVSSAWASRTPSQVRTTLGLVIGTNVQAWDADLDTWAGITPGTGVGTFLATPSSANLISAVTDETGTGSLVFANTPTLVTPVLGAATGTSLVLSSFLNEAKGADIASATTTDIGAATGNYVVVTGTTTITGLGTVQAGTRRIVKFSGVLTLTHNATSLILPGGASITTVAGDTAMFISLGSGNWICVDYEQVTWTGSGSLVLATSPTFVTPLLGTPTSGNLANCTFPTLNQNTTGSAASLSISGQTGLLTVTGLASTNRIKTVRDAADTLLELAGSYTPTGTWTSLTMVTPVLGTPTSGDLRNCTAAVDATAGVMSAADHTTLTGLSVAQGSGNAPQFIAVGVPVMAYKTGVDLKTNGTTNIFTVPTSRTFIVISAWCIPTSVTGGAAVDFNFKIEESGGSAAMTANTAAGSAAPVTTKAWIQTNASGSANTMCAAAAIVRLNITVGFTTSTTVTGTCFVLGYYTA